MANGEEDGGKNSGKVHIEADGYKWKLKWVIDRDPSVLYIRESWVAPNTVKTWNFTSCRHSPSQK